MASTELTEQNVSSLQENNETRKESYKAFDPLSHHIDHDDSNDETIRIVNEVIESKTDYFEWKDVNVTIEGKQILNNICGRVKSGQLLGILGGSGAGKTTLLNAISGRLLSKSPSLLSSVCPIKKCRSTGTQVSGSVAYKGNQFKLGSSDSIKYISAYVMQNDIMCPTSTGHEALLFSSKLRSNKNTEEQNEAIQHVITSLKLEECQNTKIGNDAIRGMSGGEKKRTSVGCELVTNPSLIFLDEPTSGLDSFTALKTLQILKSLTEKEGKQVIATIHQPSSDIFAMIDILVLLAKGHVVYYGTAKNVISYFSKLGYECPQYSNIADYVVNRVQENSEFFVDSWKKYENEYIDLNFDSYNKLSPKYKQTAGIMLQMMMIMKREFEILARDPRPSKIRLVQTIIFSLLVGILYFNLPYTSEGLRDRFGGIFFLTVNSSMTGIISTIVVFPEQRLLFERERDNNMYYTTTYVIAKSLVQIPEQAIFTLIYQLIIYWMMGLDSYFWEVYVSLFLCVTCTGSVGMIFGCFAKNAGEAMQLMPMAFIPFLLFTNFLVSLDQIPAWIRFLQWLDPFKYLVDALTITELDGQLKDFECYISGTGDEICDYKYNGNAYLKQIDAGYIGVWGLDWVKTNTDSVYFDWIMLITLVFGFRFITWIILSIKNGF